MSINTHTLDLNLIRLFCILYHTGSVGQAATRMHLSQPATSNALSRLRNAFNDPLFVRARHSMVPTPMAAELAPKLLPRYEELMACSNDQEEFDPGSNSRAFNLSLSGLGEAVFLPSLAQHLLRLMPNARLINQSLARSELISGLEQGTVDLAIGMLSFAERGICQQALFQDSFVAIYGNGLKEGPQRHIGNCKLVLCAPSVTYAKELEYYVKNQQLSHNILLNIRHFSALPELLEKLDVVAIVPQQYATTLITNGQAKVLDWAPEKPLSTVHMIWHTRSQNDSSLQWLRSQIQNLFTDFHR